MSSLILKDARDYIRLELEVRQQRRPSYSLRAFARDLRMSPSSLSDFLTGRVGMSHTRAQFMASHFQWTELTQEHFWDLVQTKFGKSIEARKNARLRVASRLKESSISVSVDAFKAISDWYHLVLIEIFQIQGERADLKQIAKQLDLTPAVLREACDRLERLGLLRKTANGFEPVESETWIGDEAPSEAVRSYHGQILQLAARSVEKFKMEERESLSLAFSVDRDDFPKLQKELRSSIMRVLQKYAQKTPANQVQCLSLQMFPVWREESNQ
jgi:uncharacterized protein (TIGR02147 family)